MPTLKQSDDKEESKYLNYAFLRALHAICHHVGMPESVLRSIENVLEEHVYDISAWRRQEANIAARELAADIIEGLVEPEMDGRWGGRRRWADGLVSEDEAAKNKIIWKDAIEKGACVEIRYVSDTSGEAVRVVEPTGTRGKYGEGYCFLRKDDRVFRFDRMLEIKPDNTDKPR